MQSINLSIKRVGKKLTWFQSGIIGNVSCFFMKKKLYEIECIAYSKAKGLHSCDYHIITSWKREGESGSKVQIYTINTISFHLNATHHISVVVNLTHVKKKTAFDIDILFMQLKIFTNVKDIYTECISKRNMFFFIFAPH